ncbi:MAG: hypothetical protein QJR00_05055 [Bacillota bacterium]|nr:hypothetical protein [Bacillota bacterium]
MGRKGLAAVWSLGFLLVLAGCLGKDREEPFTLELYVQEVNRFDPLPAARVEEKKAWGRRVQGWVVWQRERFLQPAGEGAWPLYGDGRPRVLPGASFLEPSLRAVKGEAGVVQVLAGDVALSLRPGEERRLLFTGEGVFVDEDGERWQAALAGALSREEPLAVWTLRLREGVAP